MKKAPLTFTGIFLLFSCFLHPTPDLNQPLTLAELVDVALENHPSTKQSWWNARRAAAALGYTKSLYYPSLALKGSAINGRDFKFINGPDTDYTILGADLFVSFLLYDFGERSSTVDIAKTSLVAAKWQMDWNIQKVMVKVLENAYSTLHAQEVAQAAKVSLNEAEKVLNAAKELNRTGLTPVSDVYTSQAIFSEMRMDLARQKALLDIQRGKLAASIGLSATAWMQIATPETPFSPEAEQIETLIEIALKQRADLMVRQARLEESLLNETRAKASYWPKLSFNGRAGYNYALHDKTDGAQYQISLNLEIPLFNGFDTIYKTRMAYADTQISNEQLLELQLEISLEVLTYSRTVRAAQEMLPDAEDYLQNSVNAYEGVLEKYKAGKEAIAELSNAQRQLAAARVRYSDVKTRLFVSIANLAYATGTLAPYLETP